MAAPAFVAAGTGAVITGASGVVSQSSVTVGNLLILQVMEDGALASSSLSGITNIENLAGTDSAMTAIGDFAVGSPTAAVLRLWVGRALTASPSLTVNTSGNDLYCRLNEFSGVATGPTLADVYENNGAGLLDSGAGTAAQIDAVTVITSGVDRLACNFIGVNDDNALGSFTGETGGDWALVADFGSATGTDGEIGLQTATIASAGTITGGSFTMLASDAWGVVGFALLPVVASVIPAPIAVYYEQAVNRSAVF